jgi:hypothetical protein
LRTLFQHCRRSFFFANFAEISLRALRSKALIALYRKAREDIAKGAKRIPPPTHPQVPQKARIQESAKACQEYQVPCTPNCDARHRMKVEAEAASGLILLFSSLIFFLALMS